MTLENPFFTRDVRALSRRGFGPIAWLLAFQGVLLVLPLALLEQTAAGKLQPADAWLGLSLVLLGLVHAATLEAAGWILGTRVFGEEHRLHALEGLRLITRHPARWLAQKLVFPLYALALIWAASLPVYGAVALRGHFLPRELAPGAALAICAGLLSFGAALLVPPEGLRSPIREGRRVPRAVIWSDHLLLGLPLWITLVLLKIAGDWMGYALGLTDSAWVVAPFFNGWLRTSTGLCVLLAVYWTACLGSAYHRAHPAGPGSCSIAAWSRLIAALTAYVLFLGYTWTGLGNPSYEVTAALGLVVTLVIGLPAELWERLAPADKLARPRSDDRLATGEIRSLTRLWDNPVFTRDLRVSLRGGGLFRQLFVQSALVFAGAAALGGTAGPYFGAPAVGPGLAGRVAAGALLLGSWFILPALLAFGSRALAHWQTERRCSTLPQVLATPLTCEAVVRGRWGAALVVGLARNAPVPAAFMFGVVSIPDSQPTTSHLALGFWLASLGLLLSIGLAGTAQNGVRMRDLFCAGCLAIYTVMVEGALFVWQWVWAPVVNGAPDRSGLAAFSLVCLPINLVLAFLLYRRAVADLETIRREEHGE